MYQVGSFEKVSYAQFYAAMKETAALTDVQIEDAYQALLLPNRATSGSAGYDFHAPFSFVLSPGHTIKIPTGVRVRIADGWWLGCLPRSGLGFRYRLQLDNTMGVIDSDYYYADNEGHIFAKLTNDSLGGKPVSVQTGTGFMQGIFLPYGVTYDDSADGVRSGGFGSTDRPARA